MYNYSQNRISNKLVSNFKKCKQVKTSQLKFLSALFLYLLSDILPTCEDDGGHGHVAMEVNGSVKGDVPVEESLSTERDEVARYSEEQVWKQKGDGGRCAAGDDDTHY